MTRLDALFGVSYGNKFDMNKMQRADKASGIAFIGRRGNGEGLSGWVAAVSGLPPYPAGVITVALGGSRLLSAYVQQRPFYTAQNVAVLTPHDHEMPLSYRLYYAMCIKRNAFRYTAFGREANRTLATLELPSTVPLWVVDTPIPTHDGLAQSASAPALIADPTSWAKFLLGDLFNIHKGRRLTKATRSPGATRFIGASEKNNGITDRSDVPPTFSGACLTVPYNGNSVGWAFYQNEPFFASDDVNVLLPKEDVTLWPLLFVAAVIRHERTRYTYGYKWTLERMKATSIRLPANEAGSPDWNYMAAIMRGLPFSATVEAQQLAVTA